MSEITFRAHNVELQAYCGNTILVTVEADLTNVVEDIPVQDRVHDVEPRDIVNACGSIALLSAMDESDFTHWVKDGGDYYEALNAIGIEKILEWIESYTGGH